MVAESGTWGGEKWIFAPALIKLVAQVDAACPDRNRRSDGSIASHRHYENNPHSDHDPHFFGKDNIVTAVDVTHDPKRGIDCERLWHDLLAGRDSRLKYCIFQRRIFNDPRFVSHTSGARKRGAWNPGPYDGADPHTNHIHISIWGDKALDNQAWILKGLVAPPTPTPAVARKQPAGGDWWWEVEQSLKEAGADPRSLTYTMRFFRRVAGKAGIDGSKPERVADWLLEQIGSKQ